ncbi:TPA: resolvase, partial [Salmonella enterica subsp. enterica serovar Newport]
TRVFSLDVLTGSGLSFTCDPQLAKQLLGYPERLNNE